MQNKKPKYSMANKLGMSISDVMDLTGLCKQTIYNQINNGNLQTFKVGRRRLISPEAAQNWVKMLEQRGAA